MLFDNKERSRTAPRKAGEHDYRFYDSSARSEFQIYRDLINGWIAELPAAERAKTIARFRKSNSTGYQAVVAELTIHAALIRQGYSVEIHPPCGHPTRSPDFLVRAPDRAVLAYIEVTSFGPADEHVAQSNREAAIYNAIDRAKLPAGWRLGYDVVAYGTTSPNLGDLRRSVEEWGATAAGDDPTTRAVRVFDAGDWRIELTLFGGFKIDVAVERAIAAAMSDVRWVSTDVEIRDALEKKGSRYGALEAPYLIVVVDCKDELAGGESNAEALLDAVFGTVVTTVTALRTGERVVKDERGHDGYWGHPQAPKHRNVSGVLLLPRPHLWDLRRDRWQPLLVRNPWPEHPLPDGVLPLPGYRLTDKNEFAPAEGTRLADILGLPKVWPPEKLDR